MKEFNLPSEFTQVNSKKRIRWIYTPIGKYGDIVYVPLYKSLEAKPLIELPDIVHPTPVAVYIRDAESKDKQYDCYEYRGEVSMPMPV